MGKDRQEKKLKQQKRTESDRDQSISYNGAASLESARGGRAEAKPVKKPAHEKPVFSACCKQRGQHPSLSANDMYRP